MNIREAAYRCFAAVYNTAARLPVKQDRAVFFRLTAGDHYDSVDEVQRELKKRGGYEILTVSRSELGSIKGMIRFMTVDAFRMGRAKYLFLNNNFFPMGYMQPNADTTVVQLWHGMGAFKKFGFDIPQPPEVRALEEGAVKNVDYVVCSGWQIRPIYSSAFHMQPEQVLASGTPIQDFYFREENVGEEAQKRKRAAFDRTYGTKDKYLVLYAPTFRDDPHTELLDAMDFTRLADAATQGAGRDTSILVRLHPNDGISRDTLQQWTKKDPRVIDVTDYPDGNELSLLSDVMITDYSSICMNNALLMKPIVFYAFDLDQFETDRSFYFDYESTVGGPVVKTMDDLCRVFAAQSYEPDRLQSFRSLHFGNPDGRASEKLLDRVL